LQQQQGLKVKTLKLLLYSATAPQQAVSLLRDLNNAGVSKTDILVILNDNQIAIDKNVGAMHNYLVKITTSPTYNRIKNKIWNKVGNGKLRAILQKFAMSTKIARGQARLCV
jgi:deoxyxylulose-5-phosphate synthase